MKKFKSSLFIFFIVFSIHAQVKKDTKDEAKMYLNDKGKIFTEFKVKYDSLNQDLKGLTTSFTKEQKDNLKKAEALLIEFLVVQDYIENKQNNTTDLSSQLESQRGLEKPRYQAVKILEELTFLLEDPKFDDVIRESLNELSALGFEVYATSRKIDAINKLYLEQGISQKELDEFCGDCKLPDDFAIDNINDIPNLNQEEFEEKIFLLFGTDRLIEKEQIFNNETANEVFTSVLGTESRLHLGSFWIPRDKEKIQVTTKNYRKELKKELNKKDENNNSVGGIRELEFDHIDLELFEGNLVDIKVHLRKADKIYIFENQRAVSLLRYTLHSEKVYLKNTSKQTYEDRTDDYQDYQVRLSDVLRYISQPGRNYIPDDQNFSFPMNIKDNKENSDSATIYELHQDTSLQNVLDLRTYTDFLGLFGDDPNGVTQIEGDASFFIAPFSIGRSAPIFLFKKIKPYVSYARLDNENRSLDTEMSNDSIRLVNRLDNLQQSFLDLGVVVDVFSFKLNKESPFETNLFASLRYQLADIESPIFETDNYSTLGTGMGLNFEFRRFENFKFNLSTEFTYYNQDSYNSITIDDPNLTFFDSREFWVQRTEAEVSYFPGNSRRNSIFLRVRVFNDLETENDANFFQLQFGYKFNLGLQRIRTQN